MTISSVTRGTTHFLWVLTVTQGTEKRPRRHPACSTAESHPPAAANDTLGEHVPPAYVQTFPALRTPTRKREEPDTLRLEVTSCYCLPHRLSAEPRRSVTGSAKCSDALGGPRSMGEEGERLGGMCSVELSPLSVCPPPGSAGLPGLRWPPGRRAIPEPAGNVRASRDRGHACSLSHVLSPGWTPPWG